MRTYHHRPQRGVTSSVTTRANRRNSPGLELRAFDGRGNLLLRDPQFDGNLEAATRHVATLAAALAERHGRALAEVRELPTGRLLASAEGGAL